MPNIYLTINHFNREMGITPWRYIGSDQNDNELYKGSSFQLVADIKALGTELFTKEILEQFDDIDNKILRKKEAEYLKEFNVKNDKSYYNLTDVYAPAGGKKGMKHRKKYVRSDAWKASRKNWIPSIETKTIWKTQRTGKIASLETKRKMTEKQTGEKNHNALEWHITDPIGNSFTVKSLKNYCTENNLNYGRLYHSRCGWKSYKIGQGKGGPKCKIV